MELILVVAKGKDRTEEIALQGQKDDARIKVFVTEKEGLVKAMNYGIKQAGDNDVYITQPDVIIPSLYKRDWLQVLAEAKENPNVGLVTTIAGWGKSGPDYLDGFKWVGTWSMFIPRETINIVKFYEEI
jgi:glycosyltransferase involved in cell wall biosynthesis